MDKAGTDGADHNSKEITFLGTFDLQASALLSVHCVQCLGPTIFIVLLSVLPRVYLCIVEGK